MEVFTSIRSRSIKLKSRTSTNQITSFSRSNTADYGSLYWTFDPNNHYLSPRLTKMVYNKWTLRWWVFSFIVYLLMNAAGVPSWICDGYYAVRNIIFLIPYYTLLILSFNRDACGFLIRSSEFWIKIGYAEVSVILQMILYIKLVGTKCQGSLVTRTEFVR